jgi:hypothetical protein
MYLLRVLEVGPQTNMIGKLLQGDGVAGLISNPRESV